MGLRPGEMHHGIRKLVYSRLSPYELSMWESCKQTASTWVRRVSSSIAYPATCLTAIYLLNDYCDKEFMRLKRKNPKDYENDE